MPAVGKTSSTEWEIGAEKISRPTSCTKRTWMNPGNTGYAVPVHNNTASDVVVQIWNSGTPVIDTFLWTYKGDTLPTSTDELKACYTEPASGCSSLGNICGDVKWAGVDNVTIPAKSTIVVVTGTNSGTAKGKFTLHVKTKPGVARVSTP